MASKESKDHRDNPDPRAKSVNLVDREIPVLLDHKVHRVDPERMVLADLLVNPA